MLYLIYSTITGVRFVKENKIIFLQIQTGLLLPLGMVDASTVSWQQLPQNVSSNQTIQMGYVVNSIILPDLRLSKEYIFTGANQ